MKPKYNISSCLLNGCFSADFNHEAVSQTLNEYGLFICQHLGSLRDKCRKLHPPNNSKCPFWDGLSDLFRGKQ